jgi:adenylate kinase family enzyme
MGELAKRNRIHLTGASGCGVTTIGRALATRLALPVHDTDDYYWLPTDIPYTQKRPIPDRLRLIGEMFLARPGWVLSGSLDGWGDPLVPHFDLVVFVSASTELRLARLREREARRFGADAIAQGGWRHEEAEAFFEWASHYEDGSREGRNRARHEAWLAALPCPVLRIDGSQRIEESVEAIAGY